MRLLMLSLSLMIIATGQNLPVRWEELNAVDFVAAIRNARNTCVLPFGILEKHGPHLPLGSDMINARYASINGSEKEYAIVFPEYYFGQIFEAKHQPGTIAYSPRLQYDLLQETTDEMARNGCKKILIVNGHGGNTSLLPYFAQSQLAAKKDYAVYVMLRPEYPAGRPKKSTVDGHAGESETSKTLISRPDLVKLERATAQSGADLNRLDLPANVYTGIWWYAKFPNHYSGDGSLATKELGEFDMKAWVDNVVAALKAIKSDNITQRLQQEFYEGSAKPLETKQ